MSFISAVSSVIGLFLSRRIPSLFHVLTERSEGRGPGGQRGEDVAGLVLVVGAGLMQVREVRWWLFVECWVCLVIVSEGQCLVLLFRHIIPPPFSSSMLDLAPLGLPGPNGNWSPVLYGTHHISDDVWLLLSQAV